MALSRNERDETVEASAVTSSTGAAAPEFDAPGPPLDQFRRGPHILIRSWRAFWISVWFSLRFLLQTEVHVYAFAVAANILISFFPFLVAMMIFCRSVLHWQAGTDIILHAVGNYFPENFGVPFRSYLLGAAYQKFSWLSVFLLFFTANGIFLPLEVAFNRIWHIKENRSFLRNQIVSLGLIFVCGALVLASISVTAMNAHFLTTKFGASHAGALLLSIAFKIGALPLTSVMIFLVYWVLPNARIPMKRLIPAAIGVAVLLEGSKYLNLLTWPWLRAKLRNEVPPFVQSISIILWSFVATLIVLVGAEWSARVNVAAVEGEALPPAPKSSAQSTTRLLQTDETTASTPARAD